MGANMDRIIFLVAVVVLVCTGLPPSVSGSQAQAEDATSGTAPNAVNAKAKESTAAKGTTPIAVINYGMAKGCIPPTLPLKATPGAPIPALASTESSGSSGRPNFIIILTDDQGFDDISLHQPQAPGSKPTWVNTPALDNFLRQSTEFDNFYVAPMCSQSRAMLLTGRDFARTGTMLVNGGYDYLNREEMTAGEFFGAQGYDTAHFGKWHNGRTLGYEPWELGFQDSWLPSSHVHLDNLMRHNGRYIQTKGLMEQDLMDKLLGYLKKHESTDAKPFYMYYAPHAIHQGFMRPGQGPRWQRPAPEPYKSKYKNMTPKLPSDTAEVWAMLEYLDDVLGRLFDYMDNSPLKDNTYIMVMSDNGAELFPTERRGKDKLRRMPSGMQGYKKSVEEGGIRNYLAVKGPGIQAGVVDSTLLSITDVFPTMVALAGLNSAPHRNTWDGMSFKNLLLTGAGRPPAALRGTTKANRQQEDRFIFSLAPQCWGPDAVPELGPDRQVLKPQAILDYDTGGIDRQGWARCIGIRYKDYKWLGATGKVYKFWGQSHVELPCNEVTGEEKVEVGAQLSAVARSYFESIVAEPHSFQKPIFQLGLSDWSVTNILPDGAHERTLGRIELLPNGASGFSKVGDSMCFALNVVSAGTYKVSVMYTSQVQATFKLSVGVYSRIKDGSAPSLTARLPTTRNMKTKDMGYLDLQPSNGKRTEACFVMVATSSAGAPVFENLSNIRFTRQGGKKSWEGWPGKGDQTVEKAEEAAPENGRVSSKTRQATPGTSAAVTAAATVKSAPGAKSSKPAASGRTVSSGLRPVYDVDWIVQDSPLETYEEMQQYELHRNLNATSGMRQAEQDAYRDAALQLQVQRAKESMSSVTANMTTSELAWEKLRKLYMWPDGQEEVFESLMSPYDSEEIYTCAACQPDV